MQDPRPPVGYDSLMMGLNDAHESAAPVAESINPKVITYQGVTTPGSGAVFHNQAGDLHSSTLSWIMPPPILGDELAPQVPSDTLDGFMPYIQTQDGLYCATHLDQEHMPKLPTPRHLNCDGAIEWSQNDSAYAFNDLFESAVSSNTSQSSTCQGTPNAIHESFRYNVTLSAPVAMFPHADGNPVTYLNKGHTYILNVVDSSPPLVNAGPVTYRTYVRVTFEAEEQRSNPAVAWQLWKALRGQQGALDREGMPLGVEFGEFLHGDAKDGANPRVRAEQASIDQFSVIWTSDPAKHAASCDIPVKFNFLSTDFTRAKGVKGVPVRLCVRTEMLLEESSGSEMCYCIVKLFRDHGAERKMTNDEASAKKRIEKLKHEIAKEEAKALSCKPSRKHLSPGDGMLEAPPQKRRRSAWQSDPILHHKLHTELSKLTSLLSSEREMSRLGLRGAVQDDPVVCPFALPTESDSSTGDERTGPIRDGHRKSFSSVVPASRAVDNSPSSRSIALLESSLETRSTTSSESANSTPASSIASTRESSAGRFSRYAACFLVQFVRNGKPLHSYHHAIYLSARSESELNQKLAEKLPISPDQFRVIWVNPKGVKVIVDDDMVEQIPEAQVMSADISALPSRNVAGPAPLVSPSEIRLIF
ncbi:uncharacterized protein N7482_010483 [Penicillium canariense]|uniref:Grh/CP2 DB domain-containing protein n=1 Tax=Penicillium canariense TaxID=189055 RepID=A0A9W9HMQ5_9EURO|nr:uncharacterized protein N7482_010483 [Penicillium canariense]KAJ5151231.1 hypothetical protein N7482_010483 [Penicillium canariense]